MSERETRMALKSKLDPLPPPTREEYRACGDNECVCGKPYRLHPMDPESAGYDGYLYLHVLCNGDRVKL